MAYRDVFKRYELKFLISGEQYARIGEAMALHMRGDAYGRSDICNLYYDTPDWLLVRRSNDKPIFKEKLRVRSYGLAKEDGDVFVEIKRKYDSEVYKRRVSAKLSAVDETLAGGDDSQIGREIGYFVQLYDSLAPRIFISYAREAFYAHDDPEFRMTFDRNILWRDYDLSLQSGIYGTPILPDGRILLEVKTGAAIPLWLVKVLSENRIYKTNFSKYGNAYIQLMQHKAKGGQEVA